ncbi:MAG: hypothetical protein MUF84_11665 [Anaerolineae bacterium]|jgi:hypothetical protein|nr:hypothetical protein [Anaerolineae bacterium]
MNYDNQVAEVMLETAKLIDKLELETGIPKSDRDFLAAYQAKLVADKSTSKDEDGRFCRIFTNWMMNIHKITKVSA